MKLEIEEFKLDELDELDEWEGNYQISYSSGKPSPMKTRRKKAMASWQRIEQLKDEAMLKKQISEEDFAHYS